jgi:tetratricopeptide (TPR) repeat protein
VLTRLRALDPGSPENTARVVVVLAAHRARARGRAARRRVGASASRSSGRHALLAVRAWTAAGVPDSAIARARRGVALEPDSVGPRRLLARTLQDAKRFREADVEWRALAAKLPAEPGVWLELGACRELAGDFDGAIAAGREAITRAPDWVPACNFLGYVLADHQGDLVESRRLLEKALAAEPDNGAVRGLLWLAVVPRGPVRRGAHATRARRSSSRTVTRSCTSTSATPM